MASGSPLGVPRAIAGPSPTRASVLHIIAGVRAGLSAMEIADQLELDPMMVAALMKAPLARAFAGRRRP